MRTWPAMLVCLLLPCVGLPAESPTPSSVVDRFRDAYASISDYQCRMVEHCIQGSEREDRVINIYFKRPRIIRMDIVAGNRPSDNGAVGVLKNEGKVTVRPGGLLSFLTVILDRHDTRIASIRGVTIDEIDLQGVLERLLLRLSEGGSTLTLSGGVYELTAFPRDPSREGGVTREIIRIDAATFLPVSTDSFAGDRIMQHAEWSHYIINAGLPDELFNVNWDPRQLSRLGIPGVHSVPVR